MRLIILLTIMVAMLTSGLGMIVLLMRIIPADADARLPLALTAGVMAIAGLIAVRVLTRLAYRDA